MSNDKAELNPFYWRDGRGRLKKHQVPRGFPKPVPKKYPVVLTSQVMEGLVPDESGSYIQSVKAAVDKALTEDKPVVFLAGMLAAFKHLDREENLKDWFDVFNLGPDDKFGESDYESRIDTISLASGYVYGDSLIDTADCSFVELGGDEALIPDTLAEMLDFDDRPEGIAPEAEIKEYGSHQIIYNEHVAVLIQDTQFVSSDMAYMDMIELAIKTVTKSATFKHYVFPTWYLRFRYFISPGKKKNTILGSKEIVLSLAQKMNARCYSHDITNSLSVDMPADKAYLYERKRSFSIYNRKLSDACRSSIEYRDLKEDIMSFWKNELLVRSKKRKLEEPTVT